MNVRNNSATGTRFDDELETGDGEERQNKGDRLLV